MALAGGDGLPYVKPRKRHRQWVMEYLWNKRKWIMCDSIRTFSTKREAENYIENNLCNYKDLYRAALYERISP